MISKIFGYVLFFCSTFGISALALKACDHEAEQNEIKNIQWAKEHKESLNQSNSME